MRKIVVISVILLIVVGLSFSFIPMLEKYHLYSFDQRNEKHIGEGQKFTDADGRRCLLSESDGFRCPATSSGYNADTGKYVIAKPTIDQITGRTSMYAEDPYERIPINRPP